MKRSVHLIAGLFIVSLVHIGVSLLHIGDSFSNPTSGMVIGSIFGILMPDFDILAGGVVSGSHGGSLRYHRNIVSHSGIIPLLLSLSYLFASYWGLSYAIMYIALGTATHLLIDIIPGKVKDEYSKNIIERWKWRIHKMKEGYVGGTIKGPPVGLHSKHEQKWLIINVIICIIAAVMMYIKILYHIDLNAPFDWLY